MATYDPRTKWTHTFVFAVATIALGLGLPQVLAGAMTRPDPQTMAVRQQIIAAQAERAQLIRMLRQGELRIAAADAGGRL